MKKTVITLVDDLDPTGQTEAVETVQFALDGVTYEIDLSADNAHVLRARLKEFRQAARVTAKTRTTRPRPMETDAGPGATLSRHQNGVDPAEARAWAISHGLIPENQRGVLAKKYKDAYSAFQRGDGGPLNELLRIPHQSEEGDKDWDPDGDTPVKQLDHSKAVNAATRSETKAAETAGETDAAEAEARRHYRPITPSARMADPKKWQRRTGYGNTRTDKIAEWTLTERIAALSDQNLGILGQLAGVLPLARGNKVSYLKTSDTRLENMEFIEQDPNSPHGWTITPFGRHAYAVRTSKAA
ncbi:histone-like nucleoid-structuring protein Lsr2 [Actinacidiphila sp. ITFR-21]|uniref:histone-like nucleoid-structuring protein Lsr2 n=1 Tax=Actinacidiphila sp. ITFR-21 TaxID=3075199 RepID=UPI00288BFA22|nr:Lsr2 family protein [Streptomyces sp. ITFR-21]WNI17691.1 Lsr2 family protein [Streptomyces sp. ITFR-21]WNI17831.1 Lsr2 family protein [Streptomyces sp. ITFR-21]